MNTAFELLLSNAIVGAWLALLVCGIGAFRPRPAVMHALWLIVLLKFVTPPLIRFEPFSDTMRSAWVEPTAEALSSTWASCFLDSAASEPATSDGVMEASFPTVEDPIAFETTPVWDDTDADVSASADNEAGVTSRVAGWLSTALITTWAVGSAAWFVLAGVRLARFRRQLRHTRVAGDPLQNIAADVAQRLGLGTRPEIRLSDANISPMLVTFRGQGLVLLPDKLLQSLSPPQQAAIIAHELAHFRRRDHWVRWLEFVVMGLYWWYPVAWLARRQLGQAEESCCDAWVLRVFPNQAKGYAQALLATVDFLSDVRAPVPAGASGFGRVHSLQRRLEMILQRTWRPDLSWAARILLIAIAFAILPWTPRAFSQGAVEPPAQELPAVTQPKNSDATPSAGTTNSNQDAGTGTTTAVGAVPPPAAAQQAVAAPRAVLEPQDAPVSADSVRHPIRVLKVKGTTEERLDRLEAMLTQVLTEMRNQSDTKSAGQQRQLPMSSAARRPGKGSSGTGTSSTGSSASGTSSTGSSASGTSSTGSSGTGTSSTGIAVDATAEPAPEKTDLPARINDLGRTKPMTRYTIGVTPESDIKAKLLDLEFEIQSLELQLRRAQAQRELIQKQIRSTTDAAKP